MVSKKNVGKGDNKKPQAKKKSTRRKSGTVEHSVTARWIQEKLMDEIPELGCVSDSLIETILKMSHEYYIKQGYSSVKLSDK